MNRLVEPPREIAELITIANRAIDSEPPYTPEQLEHFRVLDEFKEWFETEPALREIRESMERGFEEKFGNYRGDFTYDTFLFGQGRTRDGKELIARFKTEAQMIREAFLTIAKLGEGYDPEFPKEPPSIELRHAEFKLTLSWDGLVKYTVWDVLQKLVGVPAYRIKVCPVCERILWAGRRDKKACKGKCSSVLRTRNHRDRRRVKGGKEDV
jgi:hypothetical protein